ncbi:alpha/beta hydrolase [Nocardioides sp. JQ2195]|uniref:alpha/beta hydrolase n=1 Tax=Nocardioides sp. JQ2195 TaxID=2592334 RepID=UPI00143E4ABA|nr:alpha/beta hydrolase [Nocardioides sp. JQ2195]QIX25681.1 alpha/beta hydrolase [Nocardioides sp. JQ2195]
MTHTFSTVDVAVPGGDLRVGAWDVDGQPDAPTALLIHGVTASHRSWPLVAAHLPDVRLVAPDLRGRGRSNEVAGPAGMATHAADLVRVLDHFDVSSAVVVGHSMGAFVSVVLADLFPERVERLVLVDGGLPLEIPDGLSSDEIVSFLLGPAAERLAMTFPSVEAYLDHWRTHPAFADHWSAAVTDYFAYDLVGSEPALRPSTRYGVMSDDTVDLNTGQTIVDAVSGLRHPTRFLTAPRGLLDQTPGLYSPSRVAELMAALPAVRHTEIADTNHYTITLSEAGAGATAAVVLEELAAAPRVASQA